VPAQSAVSSSLQPPVAPAAPAPPLVQPVQSVPVVPVSQPAPPPPAAIPDWSAVPTSAQPAFNKVLITVDLRCLG